MTREENIRAILETNFAGFKDEIIDIAAKNICELEQESKTDYKSFCEFVAKTVMEEDFELNAGGNAEIFCRKLAKLGIVKADGDRWVLESEV